MSKSLGNVVDPIDVMTGKDLEALAKQLEDSGLSQAELEIARDGQRKSFPEVRQKYFWMNRIYAVIMYHFAFYLFH